MSQANEAFASSAALGAGGHQYRPGGSTGVVHSPAVTEQAGAYSGKQSTNAEAIIEALVNQYFRCSTSMSGIFLCR
jgi:hypothetical protein